jgi:RNA polymerase sigma-70 factor (ECF subfamily)
LSASDSLDSFLAGIERRAFQMARVSTGDPDAALDIVQDAMLKLVKKYGRRPAEEWPPLFYRILSNAITDWHRQRQRDWNIFDGWFGTNDETGDALESMPSMPSQQPDQLVSMDEEMTTVENAIRGLSIRQQQAFMLRCWQGFSTAETASAMRCTEGTVKTLYSRAMHSLRSTLKEAL